jgi:Pyruvate/2-oxoacid:ferredoxin oxidoreductase delta subunit
MNFDGEVIMQQSTSHIVVAIIGAVTVILSIVGSFYVQNLNEMSKRTYDEYIRKEARYTTLIESARGFYEVSENKEMKAEFINQVDKCWMYCPDDVIRKAYNFLSAETGKGHSQDELKATLQEFILAMRKDLLSRQITKNTNLAPSEFQIFFAK